MENVTQALYIAFAVFVFILAFSFALYMVDNLNTTSKTLVYRLDESNYYDSYELTELISDNDVNNNYSTRVVGIDSIIPTLYRYYKESFTVYIYNGAGEVIQVFDTTIEGDVNAAKSTSLNARTQRQKALLSLYDTSSEKCYMFGAPWLGSINKDAKARVDMFINGDSGYINNTFVDYSNNNLLMYKDSRFKETFSQYAYEGDTIQDENDELVSLTGTKQISTKIIITYEELN